MFSRLQAEEQGQLLVEFKDQKFIYNNEVCLITAKEQSEAKEFIVTPPDQQYLPLKVALTIVQLRVINKAPFSQILCGIRNFLSLYSGKLRYRFGDESEKIIVDDYIKLLDQLQNDSRTKADFDKYILNSAEMKDYYEMIGKYNADYKKFEPDFARKLIVANFLSKKTRTSAEDWQILFDMFYLQNKILPKELNEYLRASLTGKNRWAVQQLLPVYLKNANELAYNDLFKFLLENYSTYSGGVSVVVLSVDIELAMSVFNSRFVPDSFKCFYVKDVIERNVHKISKNAKEKLRSINLGCLNEVLANSEKFIVPLDSCPKIVIGANENLQSVVAKMSTEFYRSWMECRTKCRAGESCTAISSPNGFYTFLNTKYSDDFSQFNEMVAKISSTLPPNNEPLKYDYKPVGICTEKGFCGEKLTGCLDGEIQTKVSEELKKAGYRSCKNDNDCFMAAAGFGGNCVDFPINVNLGPALEMMIPHPPAPKNPKRYIVSGMPNFFTTRLSKIATQCGKPYGSWNCSSTNADVKCVQNLCVLSKSSGL